jgi:hypothetical protein
LLSAAEPLNVDEVASCLFEKSTESDRDVVKKLVVAALTDDRNSIKGLLIAFLGSLSNIAMNHCGVTIEQLGQPEMQLAVTKYGEKLGQQVMQEAFGKIR